MKEALRLMSYANCLPYTSILQGYRVVQKSKNTMKVTSQLTNENKIKRKIRNIKYKGKGQGREGTSQANTFSYGLRRKKVFITRDMIRGSSIKDPRCR